MEAKEIKEKKAEKKREDEAVQPKPNPYWMWVQNNAMLTVNDIAAFAQEDGMILMLTDKLGRSLAPTSYFIPDEVLDKLIELKQKKEDMEAKHEP